MGNPSTSAPPARRRTVSSNGWGIVGSLLDRMLEAEQPIFAFFHSYTCAQCVDMDKVLQQVYLDFTGKVALVDVNVYDDANSSLLQRARRRA